jgi:hypothetical protein
MSAGRSSLLDALDQSLVSGAGGVEQQASPGLLQSQSFSESEEYQSSIAQANSQFVLECIPPLFRLSPSSI